MRRRVEEYLKRWFVTPSSGVHLDMADGLRGFAILSVVISHGIYANPSGPMIFHYIMTLTGAGWIGVPIFFVLSGFLISLPFFRERVNNSDFWYPQGYATRRILKIVPPFYLAIAGIALMYYLRDHDPVFFKLGFKWATAIAHFTYVPKPLNNSFWSIWVEVGFYTILPFLFLALRRSGAKTTGWTIFVLLLVIPFVTRMLMLPGSPSDGERAFREMRFPNHLDSFGWGVLFSMIFLDVLKKPDQWRASARVGYAGITLLILVYFLFAAFSVLRMKESWQLPWHLEIEVRHFLPALATFLLLFLVCNPACRGAKFFSSPVLRFLGIVSYEWFLIHQPIQGQFRRMSGGAHGSLLCYVLIFMASFLVSLALATLIYHNFSLPIMRWGRSRLRKSNASKAADLPESSAKDNKAANS